MREGENHPQPEDIDPEKYLLFHSGISLDGASPMFWYPIHDEFPQQKKEFVIYDMSIQYTSPAVYRFKNEVSPDFQPKIPIAPNGCIESDIYRNLSTGEIVDFSLTLRPKYEEALSDKMVHLATAIVNKAETRISLEGLLEALTPVCRIDSEDGVSLYDNGQFAFGFGPAFGETGLGVSTQMLSQFEVGEASLEEKDGHFYQAKYTIIKDSIPFISDVKTEFTIEGGVKINADSFDQVMEQYKALLTADNDSLDLLYKVVEPFFCITARQVK